MHVAKISAHGRVAAVTALAVLVLTGCTSQDEPTAPVGAGAPVPTPSVAPPAESTPEATPTRTPTPTPTATEALTLKQRLLPTSSVPGLNARWQWQDGKTRTAGTKPFSVCAKVDLASIGATQVLERTYFPPDDSDDNAAQQIATFADAKSTAQAWSVLASWRTTCEERASADLGLRARPLTPVAVPSGKARWYLVSWEPAGEETGRFEALGMVRDGTTISVLRMTSSGQDYNYPAGEEPMVGMVSAAAALLAK